MEPQTSNTVPEITDFLTVWRVPLLLLLALPGVVQAQFSYVTNNGSITITGYSGSGNTIVIPNMINGYPVASVGNYACFQATNSSLVIATSVTNIGTGAFGFCRNLASVRIPGSVITVGSSAFAGCWSLSSLTISNGVTTLKTSAFSETALVNVNIPASITNIGTQVFSTCALLTNITVDPLNLAYQSTDGVLYNHDQTTLIAYPPGKVGGFTIPDTVGSIADFGFYACQVLTSVVIPNGVSSIGSSAFTACTSLTNVVIPVSVTNISGLAFYNCSKLARITIPSGVASIAASTFSGCTNLSSVAISSGLTSIGNSAFASCVRLTNVVISETVTNLGIGAFQSCSNLTGIYFKGEPPGLETNVFNGDNKVIVYYLPGTTGWGSTFGNRPAILWNPQFQTGGSDFGIRTNLFGFTVTGTTGIPIVLEACKDVSAPDWGMLQTCTLTNGMLNFNDPKWTNYRARFYRLRSP